MFFILDACVRLVLQRRDQVLKIIWRLGAEEHWLAALRVLEAQFCGM